MTVDGPLLCDSMLGGLARWLRRAGHDAAFAGPIDDAALVERAHRDGALLLTSDGPLLDRRSIRAGTIRALFVPRVRPFEQTVHVLDALGREVEGPRCMACGGALEPVDREAIEAEVPRETFRTYREFFRCALPRGAVEGRALAGDRGVASRAGDGPRGPSRAALKNGNIGPRPLVQRRIARPDHASVRRTAQWPRRVAVLSTAPRRSGGPAPDPRLAVLRSRRKPTRSLPHP